MNRSERSLLSCWLLLAAFCCLPGVATAACSLTFPTDEVRLGDAQADASAASDVAGFREVGTPRSGVLSLLCDADRSAVALRFRNIAGIGQDLLRWNGDKPVGAWRLRVLRASADGVPVAMRVDGKAPAAQVDIVQDLSMLVLDLSKVGNKGRHFMLELQMTGLVDKSFAPLSRTAFTAHPQVELVDAGP